MRSLGKRESTPDSLQDALVEKGRILTGGTIRNVLAVMIEKGYIIRKRYGKTHLYRAKIDENHAIENLAQDFLRNKFKGSESNLMNALLKNRDVRPEELEKIEHLKAEQKRRDE